MAAFPTDPSTSKPHVPTDLDPPYFKESVLSHPILMPVTGLVGYLGRWREELDLPNPGTQENLTKEIKMTHLSNYMFDGARADLTKVLSIDPTFQVTHTFALGSQGGALSGGGVSPGNYSFNAVFANAKTLMTGTLDHEGTLMGRFNYQWSPKDLTKVQVQFAASPSAPSLAQFEHDRIGRDYSLNLKTYNPSPADLSGAYMASYLQSLTKNVALGAEVIYQRAPTGMEESAMSYVGKYTSNKRDWIATAQVQAQGILQTTYWQKLSDKVDVAAELVLVPDVRPTERKAMATVGVKYDFRTAVFRAQVESTGKISALLEQRISPILGFLFSGEIDHWKNTSKFGLGVQIDASTLDEAQMQAAQAAQAAQAPPGI